MPRKGPVQDIATVTLDRSQVAAYVRDMAIALARFARAHELPSLATFLEMAAIDAQDLSAADRSAPGVASAQALLPSGGASGSACT
jgi:hypothetical protein